MTQSTAGIPAMLPGNRTVTNGQSDAPRLSMPNQKTAPDSWGIMLQEKERIRSSHKSMYTAEDEYPRKESGRRR